MKFPNEVCLDYVARPLGAGGPRCLLGPFCQAKKRTLLPIRVKKVQRKQRDIKQPKTEMQKARQIAVLKIYGESDRHKLGNREEVRSTCSGLKRPFPCKRSGVSILSFKFKSLVIERDDRRCIRTFQSLCYRRIGRKQLNLRNIRFGRFSKVVHRIPRN